MADIPGLATAAAQKYGVPSDVFLRLVNTESGGDTGAVSPKGAIGPAQLMPATAADLGVDPHDPAQNLDGGARYLRQQYDRFGDWNLAAAAYNAGPGRVAKAHGVPNITETKNYVGKVMPAQTNGDDSLPSVTDLLGGSPAQAPVQAPAGGNPQPQPATDQTPGVGDLVPPMAAPQAPHNLVPTPGVHLNPEAVADVKKLNANVPDWEKPLADAATWNFGPKLGANMVAGETWINNNVAPIFAGHKTGYTPQEAHDAFLAQAKTDLSDYAKAHPITDTGLRIAGGFLAPGAKGLGKLGPVAGGAVAGGLSGVGSADQGNEGPAGAFGAGVGALTGLVAPALAQAATKGATALARPVVNAVSDWTQGALPKMTLPNFVPQNARQQLVGEGVNLTLGQAAPWLKPVEDTLAKVPIVGDAVRAAQGRSVTSFNTAAVNRALSPIGEALPANVKAGNEAVVYAQQRVGQAYDRVLSQIKAVPADQGLAKGLQAAQTGSAAGHAGVPLADNEANHLSSIVKWVQGAFQNGSIDGAALKHITSELGKVQIAPSNSVEFANRISAIRSALNAAAARSNPAQAADLIKTDAAYAALARLNKAAAAASNTGGIFTPSQLGSKVVAADKSANKRASAAGSAPLQDLAQAAAQVIGGASAPGAHGGGGHGGLLGAGLAALVGEHFAEPWLAAHPAKAAAGLGMLGTLALPYTPAGQKVVSQMVGRGATTVGQNARQFVAQNVPALMPYVGGLLPPLPQPQPKAVTRR